MLNRQDLLRVVDLVSRDTLQQDVIQVRAGNDVWKIAGTDEMKKGG